MLGASVRQDTQVPHQWGRWQDNKSRYPGLIDASPNIKYTRPIVVEAIARRLAAFQWVVLSAVGKEHELAVGSAQPLALNCIYHMRSLLQFYRRHVYSVMIIEICVIKAAFMWKCCSKIPSVVDLATLLWLPTIQNIISQAGNQLDRLVAR